MVVSSRSSAFEFCGRGITINSWSSSLFATPQKVMSLHNILSTYSTLEKHSDDGSFYLAGCRLLAAFFIWYWGLTSTCGLLLFFFVFIVVLSLVWRCPLLVLVCVYQFQSAWNVTIWCPNTLFIPRPLSPRFYAYEFLYLFIYLLLFYFIFLSHQTFES